MKQKYLQVEAIQERMYLMVLLLEAMYSTPSTSGLVQLCMNWSAPTSLSYLQGMPACVPALPAGALCRPEAEAQRP